MNRYLDFESELLAWVLVVDCIFVLNFLESYSDKKKTAEDKLRLQKLDAELLHIETLVADLLMLENQIPLDLLQKIVEELRDEFSDAQIMILKNHVKTCCIEQSPLIMSQEEEHVMITNLQKKD